MSDDGEIEVVAREEGLLGSRFVADAVRTKSGLHNVARATQDLPSPVAVGGKRAPSRAPWSISKSLHSHL